ncbi:MAG: CPBP family intramembrane metalloprotease [Bacteroidales bacterium]|nr:CPBP family intramembrane metalloprotease [Bacteroidales bacterium]
MRFYLPSWAQCLILVLIFFVGSVAASVFYLSGIESSSLTYAATMLLPLLWAFLISRRNQASGLGFVPLDEPRPGRFKSMLPVFATVIVATPFLAALIEPLTALFPMSDIMRAAFEKMFDTSRPVDTFIAASILAPLCEELLCRGLICRGLLARNKPWVAIVVSALIFALLHGNLQQGTAAFGLGLFMGWVYYKTHSLWATIAIHFVNNTLSQVLMGLFPDLPIDATYASVIPQPWYTVFLIVSALITAASIYLIYRNYKDDQSIISFEIRPASSGEAMGRECPEE